MLGAGFLHMLVDATDDLSTLEVFNSTTFLPHLLSVVGILIPFALEKSGEIPERVAPCGHSSLTRVCTRRAVRYRHPVL